MGVQNFLIFKSYKHSGSLFVKTASEREFGRKGAKVMNNMNYFHRTGKCPEMGKGRVESQLR